MYYSMDEARKLAEKLTKTSLKSLSLGDSNEPYLSEVCDSDVDNLHNCVNVWLAMYNDLVGQNAGLLKTYIEQRTIVAVILEATELRLRFIKSGLDFSIFPIGTPWSVFNSRFVFVAPITPMTVLQILGFPKRLHFTKANLGELALEKLRAVNRDFSEYQLTSADGLTTYAEGLYDWQGKRKEITVQGYNTFTGLPLVKCRANNWDFSDWHFHPVNPSCSSMKQRPDCIPISVDFIDHTKLQVFALMKAEFAKLGTFDPSKMDAFRLPPGSTFERKLSTATYLNKYADLSANKAFVKKFMDIPDDYFIPDTKCHARDVQYVGKVMTVPKDVKSFRTVMPEEVARQFVGFAYTDVITRSLRHEKRPYTMNYSKILDKLGIKLPAEFEEDDLVFGAVDITNQRRNQLAAYIGSITNKLATGDLTSASDTISVELCRRILPTAEFNLLMGIRAKYMLVSGKKIKSNIMFTMGFAATFIVESRMYTAAGRAAVRLAWPLASEEDRKFFRTIDRALASTFSYGDDIIIPSFAFGAFELVCEKCGFKVNSDKSYWDGPYRESCGEEYYNGQQITIDYYPRGTSSTRLAELIGLQHKLYILPSTNAFIIYKCSTYRANLTQNHVGSPYMDIYVPVPSRTVKFMTPYVRGWSVKTLYGSFALKREDHITADKDGHISVPNTRWFYHDYPITWLQGSSALTGIGYTIVEILSNSTESYKVKRRSSDHDDFLDHRHVLFQLVPLTGTYADKDHEGYCQVTMPSVQFSSGNTSDQALDNVERLAYVMSLAEMSRRPAMNSDEYLEFMVERDSTRPANMLKTTYEPDHGIIVWKDLRKSLSSHSSIKLVRKFVADPYMDL